MASEQPYDITVCFISRRFHPITAGGSERWRRFLTQLNNNQNRIKAHVQTIQYDFAPLDQQIDGLSIRRYPLKNNSLTELTKTIVEQFEKNNNWPDVVILESGFNLLMTTSIYKLSGHSKLMLATTMSLPKKLKLPTFLLRRLEAKFVNYLFDVVLCGSVSMLKDFKKLGIKEDNLRILQHGVAINRFRPYESLDEFYSLREKLNFDKDEKVLLFVGHLTERKGVHFLLDAFNIIASKYPNLTLNFVGGRWQHDLKSMQFADMIEKKVEVSPYSSRIRLIDAVSNIEEYCRIADIFVFPSEREGVPNSVLEAMASGLPCILTPFVGLSEELGSSGKEYILAQRDSESLAYCISNMLDDKIGQQKMGQVACQHIRDNITLQSSIQTLERIILETI